MSVRMIVDDAALEEGMTLLGLVRPKEGLIQGLVCSDGAQHETLRRIGEVVGAEGRTDGLEVQTSRGRCRVILESGMAIPGEVEVSRFEEGLDARRGDDGQSAALAQRTVVMIGAGSVGSAVAALLAQAGVGRMTVVDRDRIDAPNLSRHACDVHDIGRAKSHAVADLIGRRMGKGEAIVADVLQQEEQIREVIEKSDLVVASTDSPAAQLVVNEICVELGIPAVFAAVYERACGGEVVTLRAGTPCLYCSVGFRGGAAPNVVPKEQRMIYQAADANRLDAEPGLAVDIGFVVAVAASYALAILDPTGSRGALLEAGRSFALLHGGSAPRAEYADLFRGPFDLTFVRVQRPAPCPVCGFRTKEGANQ